MRTSRHAYFNHTLTFIANALLKDAGLPAVVAAEPQAADIWSPNPAYVKMQGDADDPRADHHFPDLNIATDTVITHPHPAALSSASLIPGATADERAKLKHAHYSRRFIVPPGTFYPIAVETGGRFHPEARAFLSKFAAFCVNKPKSDFNADDRLRYTTILQELLDTLSVAVAKSTAKTLLSSRKLPPPPVRHRRAAGGPAHAG